MKYLAQLLITAAGAAAVFQWWQISYRLRLFFLDSGGERGANHIGDGDFMLIYLVNALLLIAAFWALRALRYDRRWRITTTVVGAANLFGWLTFFVMHRTGALVEYGEFTRHWRGEF